MSKVEKILIPDLPAPYTISRNNLDAPKHIIEKISFVGINAPFVGSKSSAPTKKEIKKVREDLDFNDLFLYVPLSGPKKLRVSLIPTIIKAANNLKINTLIVTGDPKHELNKEKGYVKIVNWVKDKKVMLASCDFTVSRSGLSTIGENIMCAVPSVLIPPPRQREQEINAESMASMGAAVNLKQSKLFFRSKLEKTIKETIDNLSEIKKNVKKLSAIANKFNPTKTIVSEILNNSKSY